MSVDVLIAGAGPAGSFAALLLARAGVHVRLLDRATFPRDKLCGDTLNPGTMAILRRHGLAAAVEAESVRVTGMIVTGEGGVRIRGEYGPEVCGRALPRRQFDSMLVDAAVAAGAALETRVVVRGPWLDDRRVRGVRVAGTDGRDRFLPAALTIAADGSRSVLARSLRLTRQPRHPRRWALGAYFSGVAGLTSCGEMHVRRGHYVGVAPLAGGVTNACLVLPRGTRPHDAFRRPALLLEQVISGDEQLSPRFAGARRLTETAVLGPLAVDALAAGAPGLLLAGDAAGFIDPMTGDGLRFALRGAELAVEVALTAIASGEVDGAHEALASRRRREFAGKWRINRTLRALVASPVAVSAAAPLARCWPAVVQRVIRVAGDVP